MQDYTLRQNKINNDFVNVVFKMFRKVRYGIQSITTKDINYDLAMIRKELLDWQLLPGTNRTLFGDTSVYPVIRDETCGCDDSPATGFSVPAITPVIINNPGTPGGSTGDIITEVVDEITAVPGTIASNVYAEVDDQIL